MQRGEEMRSHRVTSLVVDGEAIAGSFNLTTRHIGPRSEWSISGQARQVAPPPETGRAVVRLAPGQTVAGDVLLTIHRVLVTRNPKAVLTYLGTGDLEGEGAANLW